MNWLQRIGLQKPPQAAPKAPPVSAGVTTSGRATYALGLPGINSVLPRSLNFELLRQFYRGVPLMARAVDILAGFVGTPTFVVDGNERASEDLNQWALDVEYGRIGKGLSAWLKDHLSQSLVYGFGVGEAEIGLRREGVTRIWSYLSPQFGFRTTDGGEVEIVQDQRGRGLVALDPATAVLTTHRPEGCDPNGTSLFFASGTFCQAWLDIVYAYRATQRRSGIPIYHIHVELPETLNDPDGSISNRIREIYQDAWDEGIRSQAQDGLAKDFVTVSVGQSTVKPIGVESEMLSITEGKRAIVEEIVTATGIPPFLLGLHWSSTERMSSQQSDLLLTTIDDLRRMVEPSVRSLVDLRQRLALKRDGLSYQVKWKDVTLRDAVETARAAQGDAIAQKTRLEVAERLWQLGIWGQPQVAEHVTGSDEVVVEMEEHPGGAPSAGETEGTEPDPLEDGEPTGENAADAYSLKELLDAYAPGTFAGSCNGKH